MLTKTLAAGLLATACFCAPAMAQDNTGSGQPAATQPMNTNGMNKAGTNTSNNGVMSGQKFYTNTSGGEWRASKFMGMDIYGSNNQKIGDVREMIMDHDGTIKAVVVGVGGFLGIGEKDVAIPFNEIQWTQRQSTAANNANGNANMAANHTAGTAAGTTANGTNMANNAAGTAANNSEVTGTTVASDAHQAYPDRGVVTMTKDELKNAPTYKYPDDRRSGNGSTNQ